MSTPPPPQPPPHPLHGVHQEIRVVVNGNPSQWRPLVASMMTRPLPPHPATLTAPLFFPAYNALGAAPFLEGECVNKIVLIQEGKVTFDTKV